MEGNAKESVLVAWKALEYPEYIRGTKYYLIVGIVFLGLIGYSVYAQDWFGIVILVILAGSMYWYQKKSPVERTYRFSQLGLYIDNRFYPYNEMFSYWFLLNGGSRSMNIIFQKKYLPQLTIMLGEIDPLKIRETVGKYIPEEGTRTENIADRMMRWLRL